MRFGQSAYPLMTGPLPWRPVLPRDGVELTETVEEFAAALLMSWSATARLLGLSSSDDPARLPPTAGVWLADERIGRVATRLGVAEESLASATLRSWKLLLPEQLSERDAARQLLATNRFRISGCPRCPQCLQEGRGWQIRWRLAWVHSCVEHQRQLVRDCSRCGRVSPS